MGCVKPTNQLLRALPFAIITFIIVLPAANGANILAIFPSQYASHRIQFQPLTRALAAKGHHVTVLSGFPEAAAVPNYRDIVIEGMREAAEDAVDFTRLASADPAQNPLSPMVSMLRLVDGMEHVLHHSMQANGTRTLLESREQFHLIFLDITSDESFYGFIHKFGYPPVIGLSPYGFSTIGDLLVGNPENPAAVPSSFLPFSDHMAFYQRFVNAIMFVGTSVYNRLVYLPKMDALLKAMFGRDAPSVAAIGRQISMVMVNSDVVLDYPRPLVPATVLVGGMHLKPAKPLPRELKQFIEDSPHGVIYFSLGSVVRSDKMTRRKLDALLAAFAALPQRVLWKWESAAVPALPANVRVGRWLPQNDVLGHPNVTLFITHGGLCSLEEAVYHGVPLIAMPFFGDQPYQTEKIVARGIGLRLDYQTLTKDTLLDAVGEVLHNPSYRERMTKLSAIYKDQPQLPLERAVFWTEYVLRHDGAQHLRHAGSVLPWYLHLQLDLFATLLGVGGVLLVATAGVARAVLALLGHRASRREAFGWKFVPGVASVAARALRAARNVLLALFAFRRVLFQRKRVA